MAEKTIKEGFLFPFTNWKRLFYFWWVLTIIGIFTVIGYFKQIVKQFLKKDFKGLPKPNPWWQNTKDGFFLFLVMLIPAVAMALVTGFLQGALSGNTFGQLVYFLIALFLDVFLALLFINYIKSEKYEDVYDVKKVWKVMSKDWEDTALAVVKTIAIMLGLVIVSIPVITLVVTLPAMSFVGYYFMADLYNRRVA
ncbi:DUF4013 domain-containing protein [Candidatus Woesearchaeota archaeon]|nr:DUF4013 domain-containing protein [Candidatus Woesearchaeota archaeon]